MLVLLHFVNPLTMWLTFATFVGYAVVYTMLLKPMTPQNIVIGGAAGAFPPLIGWAAVTGDVSALPLLLFAIIFAWTPPHFWALALFMRGDYAAAGIPMLPVTAGPTHTRAQIALYSVLLAAVSLAPALLGLAGPLYGYAAAALGLVFMALALRVSRNTATEPARMRPEKRLFAYSIVYLFALFAALLLDRVA